MHFAGQQGLDKQHNLMEVLSLGYFTQEKFIGDKLLNKYIAAHSLSIARYSPPPQSLPFLNATTKVPEEVVLPVQIENLNDYNLKYRWEFYTVKKVSYTVKGLHQ